MTKEHSEKETSNYHEESPRWNWTTKLVAGLALVALTIWLLVQFHNFLGPIITAVILAYLFHPIATFLQEKVKIPWRFAVTIIYVIFILSVMGGITWGGLALTDQIQNLIRFINNNIDKLPDLVEDITQRTYEIGPFTFDLRRLNWDEIANEIVSTLQPLLGQIGSFASSIATGAANIVSWFLVIFLISYFLLVESEGVPGKLLNIKIPGYSQDFKRIGSELNRIWNAFIRGEFLIVLVSQIIYTILLGSLGLQFFLGLAAIASIGQLIPYIGAWVTWISFGLVALFQSNPPLNLPSGIYMIIVLALSMIANTIIDSIIRTKVMAESLKVHPALVLMGALIGVQLFGVIGIVIAAPVMASIKLILTYVIKKLSDQNPWEELDTHEPVEKAKWVKFTENQWSKILSWLRKLWQKFKAWVHRTWCKLKKGKQNKNKDKKGI
jgi:predicted PurR-regulated permease PerM